MVVELGFVTGNAAKLLELRSLVPAGYAVLQLDVGEVEETGCTFEENATLKALAGLVKAEVALGEDSGLEVNALGGAPGVHSKRYGGSDQARIQRVLSELGDRDDRRARFVTVIALARRQGPTQLFRGEVTGVIASVPRGDAGFGYDPIFIPDEGDGRSFAEMTREEKGRLSHRGRALAALVSYLG